MFGHHYLSQIYVYYGGEMGVQKSMLLVRYVP